MRKRAATDSLSLFLLILIAGVWIVAAEIPQLKYPRARRIVAGVLLAVAGALLIIATHWGHFR